MPRSITIAIAFLAFLPASAPAFHHVTPPVVQITPLSGAGTIANQQWAGIRFVIFDSDADLLGSGSTGHQIYLFDLLERDLHDTQALFRLTSGPGDNRHGTSGKLANAIVYDTRPNGITDIRCPNAPQHTNGRDGAILYPPKNPGGAGWLKCSHAHCADLTLIDWVKLLGGRA